MTIEIEYQTGEKFKAVLPEETVKSVTACLLDGISGQVEHHAMTLHNVRNVV